MTDTSKETLCESCSHPQRMHVAEGKGGCMSGLTYGLGAAALGTLCPCRQFSLPRSDEAPAVTVDDFREVMIDAAEEIEARIREMYGNPPHPAYEHKVTRDMELPLALRGLGSGRYVLCDTAEAPVMPTITDKHMKSFESAQMDADDAGMGAGAMEKLGDIEDVVRALASGRYVLCDTATSRVVSVEELERAQSIEEAAKRFVSEYDSGMACAGFVDRLRATLSAHPTHTEP